MIEQRRTAKIIKGHHLADHDPMVAAVHLLVFLTVKTRRAIGEYRRATLSRLVFDQGEAVFTGAREIVG